MASLLFTGWELCGFRRWKRGEGRLGDGERGAGPAAELPVWRGAELLGPLAVCAEGGSCKGQGGQPESRRPGGGRAAVAFLWPWGAPGEARMNDSGGLGDAARKPWPGAAPVQAAPLAERCLQGQ